MAAVGVTSIAVIYALPGADRAQRSEHDLLCYISLRRSSPSGDRPPGEDHNTWVRFLARCRLPVTGRDIGPILKPL
jgi:hypothetical protein